MIANVATGRRRCARTCAGEGITSVSLRRAGARAVTSGRLGEFVAAEPANHILQRGDAPFQCLRARTRGEEESDEQTDGEELDRNTAAVVRLWCAHAPAAGMGIGPVACSARGTIAGCNSTTGSSSS